MPEYICQIGMPARIPDTLKCQNICQKGMPDRMQIKCQNMRQIEIDRM